MQKPMKVMLLIMAILLGGIFLFKFVMQKLQARAMAGHSRATAVAVMKADYSDWQKKLSASGSLRAIQGVNVTTQLPGMVQKIYFTPGAFVRENEPLVQLIADDDIALLQARLANAELANLTYLRDKRQLAIHAISQQILDNDMARLKDIKAQVAQQQAIVDKKTIRAPFEGYLGINYVNPGQYLTPGDKVTTLQQLDPIYIDFFIPQQLLTEVKKDQEVQLGIDGFPKKSFHGKITTIEPVIDASTRNAAVEARIDNRDKILKPGMFVNVDVIVGKPKAFITVPQTAISFNSYGDIIYLLERKQKNARGQPVLTVKQRFVTTGETRGEQIQVLKGLRQGEEIVVSGQLKLHNGSEVIINNAVVPSNNPDPVLNNNH